MTEIDRESPKTATYEADDEYPTKDVPVDCGADVVKISRQRMTFRKSHGCQRVSPDRSSITKAP